MNAKYMNYRLFVALTSPFYYVCGAVLAVFCGIYVFFVQKFFGGNGTTDLYSFFTSISYASFVLIPFLCFNEDDFFSSVYPGNTLETVLSRTFSVLIEFVLMLVPLILIPVSINFCGDTDAGQCVSGFTGIVFYSFATICFCQFISAAIKKSLAAMFIQIIVLTAAGSIHLFLFYLNVFPPVLWISRAISLSWHFDSFCKGIIDTRNYLYFFMIGALSVFFSVIIREKSRGRVLNFLNRKKILLAFTALVLLALDSQRYFIRKDISSTHNVSVSSYTKKLAESFDDKVLITYYRSSLLSSIYPQIKDIADYLYELSLNRNIIYRQCDPAVKHLEPVLAEKGISGRQIQNSGSNRTELTTVYSAVVIEYAGETEIIPFILSANSIEYDISVRFQHLLFGKQKIVNILCGNGKSLSGDYSYLIPWLNSQNIIVNELKPESDFEKDLEAYNSLVLLGSSSLTPGQSEKIISYLQKGGKAFLCVSPYNIDIDNNWYVVKPENQYFIRRLEEIGIGFGKCLMTDVSCSRITMESSSNSDGSAADSTYSQYINYPYWINLISQKNSPAGITLFWPAEISSLDDSFLPYLYTTNSACLIEPDELSSENLFVTNPFDVEKITAGKEKSTFVCALTDRNHTITVIPDQYFLSSLMMGYIGGNYGDYRNLDFLTEELLKISGEEKLSEIYEKSTLTSKNTLYKIYDQQSFERIRAEIIFVTLIFSPLLVIAAGLIMITLRKKEILLKW